MDKTRAVDILRGLYRGETVSIIGKGPSLRYLRAEHIEPGPVITINDAILIVQDLPISNVIYSMQKDGGESMVLPHDYVWVILQDPDFSENCLPEHPLRMWVDPVEELGFDHPAVMSIRMCIALAKIMGCAKIHLIACGSLAGNFETFDVKQQRLFDTRAGNYQAVKPLVECDLANIPHELILPRSV